MAMSGSRADRTHALRLSLLDGLRTAETFCGHQGCHDPADRSCLISEDGRAIYLPSCVGEEPTCKNCRRGLGLPVTKAKEAA